MAIVGAIAVPHPPLIVPAVGRGEESRIQATIDAYEEATDWLLAQRPDCLVVTSPHAPLFRDAFHITTDAELAGDMGRFHAPHERLRAVCDVELARAVARRAEAAGIPCADSEFYRDDMDHATYVPLHFVRRAYGEGGEPAQDAPSAGGRAQTGDLPCKIVRIGLSGLPPAAHRKLGNAIAQAADELGRRVGFIASGDLSHKLLAEGPYGFAPEGPVFDERICELFESGDFEGLFGFDEAFCEAAAECGLRSFQIMAGALDGLACQSRLLAHEGTFGVGYGVATFAICSDGAGVPDGAGVKAKADGQGAAPGEDASPDECVRLARLSVETFVKTGRPAAMPGDVSRELLERRAGAFVSLHEHGELRGCIGTIGPTCETLAEEILRNGISACSRDPRFSPVRQDELDFLEYSVDVLAPAEPIESADALDPRRFGVIVTKGSRRGLLLPNLDGVDTVEDQLAIAKRKAGIDPSDSDVQLERFEVVRHTAGGEPRRP